MAAVNTENLLMGPVEVYVGLFGATEPTNAEATPGVGWTNVGGTTDGATLTMSRTFTNMAVDQVPMAVGARLTEQGAQVATNLAEATLPNLRVALNKPAGVGTTLGFGSEDIVNSDPGYQAVLLKGRAPEGGPRLWIVRRTLSTESIGIPFTKDGMTVVPVTWTAYYVSASLDAVWIDETPAP